MNTTTKRFTARRDAPAEREPERNPTACTAIGCPLPGSLDMGGGGRYVCHCHARAEPMQWPRVTHDIADHDWLLGLIADLRKPEQATGWRAYATAFWHEAEPDMVPHKDENRDLYLYRLHLDLEHRVGVRTGKPAPQLPQGHGLPRRRVPGSLGDALAQREGVLA